MLRNYEVDEGSAIMARMDLSLSLFIRLYCKLWIASFVHTVEILASVTMVISGSRKYMCRFVHSRFPCNNTKAILTFNNTIHSRTVAQFDSLLVSAYMTYDTVLDMVQANSM